MSRQQLVDLFRSFGSMPALLPIGGEHIWGNSSWAADGLHAAPFLSVHAPTVENATATCPSTSGDDDTNDDGVGDSSLFDAARGERRERHAHVALLPLSDPMDDPVPTLSRPTRSLQPDHPRRSPGASSVSVCVMCACRCTVRSALTSGAVLCVDMQP